MNKVYATYYGPSAFHWNTELSEKRRQEICDWVASLSDEHKQMIEDMLDDTRDAIQWEEAYARSISEGD